MWSLASLRHVLPIWFEALALANRFNANECLLGWLSSCGWFIQDNLGSIGKARINIV
jgi:hypothetical protein